MFLRLLLLMVVFFTACADTAKVPPLVQGRVSMSGFTGEETGVLEGEWAFQRGLVRPPIPLANPIYTQAPASWDAGEDAPMSGPMGEGTYGAVFEDLPDVPLTLEVTVGGATEAYVDGELVAQTGHVPLVGRWSSWDPVRFSLPASAERAEVRLVIANDAVRVGGVTGVVIGSEAVQEERVGRRLALDMLNVSVLMTFFLVFIVIGLRRRAEPAYILFAALCATLALREMMGGKGDLRAVLLPMIEWPLAIRLEYFTLPLGTAVGWGTITHVSRMMRRHPVTWAILVLSTILGVVTLVAPVHLFAYVLPASQVLLLSTAVGVFVLLVFAAIRGDRQALPFLVAMSILLVAVSHDVLISMGFFETGVRLGTVGFLAVIAAFGLLLVGDFVRSFLLNEQLNAELQRSHGELQRTHQAVLRFVPDAFISLLGKTSIVEVERGDHTQAEMEILFCDLRSFTTLIEALGPDRAFPFVNRYLRHMEPAITGNGGFIAQYLGDCIMALFPGASADAAVRAAIQMTVALADFNEREAEGPVRFGIGVASGPLMLGTIGGHERLDGGVIGDAVNHASRVEGMSKMYGTVLIIDESTRRRLTGAEEVRLRELDRVVAKGRRQASSIWEVLDALPREERLAKLEGLEDWNQALKFYREGDIQSAKARFQACLQRWSRDEAARLFLRRCEALAREGLPPRWDGTTVLSKK